jgi:DNA adenine methylase
MPSQKNTITLNSNNHIRPILKWPGGKSGLKEKVLALFPKTFHAYFEPFFGGGAIFLNLKSLNPHVKSYINDLNLELINFYKVVRDSPKDLIEHTELYKEQYSEEFFYSLRSEKNLSSLESAARTLFLNKTCFNGLYRLNSKGEFNSPFGKREKCPKLYNEENLFFWSNILKKSFVFNEDFETFLEKAKEGDLVYCDPPYLPKSKTSSFTAYHNKGFDLQEQTRLRNTCLKLANRGVKVIVSNSDTKLSRELFRDFKLYFIEAKRYIAASSSSRGSTNEILASLNI